MKIKLLILVLIASSMTYFIYTKYYHKEINVTSINSYSNENNYNEFLSSEIANNNLNYKLNVDYSSPDLEIENLIASINNNLNKVQSIIHNTDVLIISLGNVDMKTETTQNIIKEYKTLFTLLRKYNSKEIIFLTPLTIKNITDIKSLCQKSNIIFINTSSYLNNYSSTDILSSNDSSKLAKLLMKYIKY